MRVWRGSVVNHEGRLRIVVKIDGAWKQVKTPYRTGQEREARALLDKTRALLLAGEDAGLSAAPTVAEYAPRWLAQRRSHGIASVDDDASRLRTHILPAIGPMLLADVYPRHVAELIATVRIGGAAPRTTRNIYAVVRALFRDAMIAGLASQQPCILTHHQLGKVRDAKHEWRAGAVFSATELAALVSDARVPQDRRVLYALASLGCLRHGEAAALRWRHVVQAAPLGRLVVANSNEAHTTKTGVERWMPVHPRLAAMLAEWRLSGWPREFGRSPGADDLVVPHTQPRNRGPRVEYGGMRADHDSYKRLLKDCDELGLRPRRFHDLRRTGVTLYREAGADKDRLRLCTHGRPGGDVIELYTSFGWAPLCGEVGKLPFFVRPLCAVRKTR